MLEKIKNLQWHYQLILLVGIASLVYGSVYYFMTSVTREEVRVKNEEVAVLQAKNEAARVATQRIEHHEDHVPHRAQAILHRLRS